jgi:hypothetical protein
VLQLNVGVCEACEVGCEFCLGKIGRIESEETRPSYGSGRDDSINLQSTQRALNRGKRGIEDSAQLARIAAIQESESEQHSRASSSPKGAGFSDTHKVSYDTR